MSIYYCQLCDRCRDSDLVECEDHPRRPGELVCVPCLDKEGEEDESE